MGRESAAWVGLGWRIAMNCVHLLFLEKKYTITSVDKKINQAV